MKDGWTLKVNVDSIIQSTKDKEMVTRRHVCLLKTSQQLGYHNMLFRDTNNTSKCSSVDDLSRVQSLEAIS